MASGASTATINTLDKAAVNTAYKNLWAAGNSVASGWNGSISSCTAGDPSVSAVYAQLNAVNFARQMNALGVVRAVTLGDAVQNKVQQAALVMAANGALSHSITSSWKCFTTDAAYAAANSNLGIYASSPVDFIHQYLGESNGAEGSDTSVGHRRWLLNPPSSVFAFGLTSTGSAVQVVNLPQTNTANPAYVAWPSAGYFPDGLEPSGIWSLATNSASANFSNATISVTHNGAAVAVTKYAPVAGFGRPTLVWKMPSTLDKTGTYTVTVKGIVIGTTTYTRTYSVNFFTPY
jgi:hypothetical protein